MIYELREQHVRWIERGLAACDRGTSLSPDLPEVMVARAHRLCPEKVRGSSAACSARHRAQARTAKAHGTFSGAPIPPPAATRRLLPWRSKPLTLTATKFNAYMPYINSLERLGLKKEAAQYREKLIVVLQQQLERVPEDVRARILWPVAAVGQARQPGAPQRGRGHGSIPCVGGGGKQDPRRPYRGPAAFDRGHRQLPAASTLWASRARPGRKTTRNPSGGYPWPGNTAKRPNNSSWTRSTASRGPTWAKSTIPTAAASTARSPAATPCDSPSASAAIRPTRRRT